MTKRIQGRTVSLEMVRPIASETLLKALKKGDRKWVAAIAEKDGKTAEALNYEDVSNKIFGPHTMARILDDVEWSFGVSLPLSISGKQWRTNECLNYLSERATNPKVNLKLAQSRRPTHQRSKVIFFAGALTVALGIPAALWQYFGNSMGSLLVGLLGLGLIWIMSLDAIATELHYRKLERRKKTFIGFGHCISS